MRAAFPVHRTVSLLLAVVPAAALLASAPAQEPDPDAFTACREHVLPTADELAWLALPWRDTLDQAALDADAQQKPILLWAMNGHPLSCT